MWHFGLFGHLWMQRDRSGVLPGLFLAKSIRTSNGKEAMLPSGLSFFSLVSSFLLYICITMGSRFLSPLEAWSCHDTWMFVFCHLAEMWPAAWKGNEELHQAISEGKKKKKKKLEFQSSRFPSQLIRVASYKIKSRQVQSVIYTSTFSSVRAPSHIY